jgi:DNA polymerase-3 subunit delta'
MDKDLILQKGIYGQLVAWLAQLPHALLLHGPLGVGKLQLAEHFARLLLCESGDAAAEPCGRCDGCRWAAAGNHPDLRIVEPEVMARRNDAEEVDGEADGAGRARRKPSIEIRIEQIRELDGFIHLGSHRARRRIAILHPAEDMNLATANALLKNLEEPPAAALFILVSHRPARLLPTVRSRCIQLAVPAPDASAATRWLEAQGIEKAGEWLAFAGGAPLLAAELAGSERSQQLRRWRSALEGGDFAAIDPGSDRKELERFVDTLQKHALDQAMLRFGLLSKYGGRSAESPVGSASQWLACARALGRDRLLARHPLNPTLFAEDLLTRLPGSGR